MSVLESPTFGWSPMTRTPATQSPTKTIPVARARRSQFTFATGTSLERGRRDSPPAPGAGQGVRPGGLASCGDGLDSLFLERCLRRGEPGERHAIRRAGDVVEAEAVAERDRLGLAAVLAADAHLQVFLHAPASLDGDPHQVAHPGLVERLERVALEHAVLEVAREELALGVVP